MPRIGKFLFILLLLLPKSSGDHTFNDQNTLQGEPNIWMKHLDNNKLLSAINIPGTHETMALHGGPLPECQAWELENQLKAGIRYLDLRVSGEKNLPIKHGIFYQFTTISTVLNIVKTFLSKYNSETVLIRIKPIFILKKSVANRVQKVINNNNDNNNIDMKNLIWDDSTMPSIGDVRGKIVFVQKDSFKLGVNLIGTDCDNDYKVTAAKQKKERIESNLKKATVECGGDSVVLNYSSGTGVPKARPKLTPKNLAKDINPWLYDYLQQISSKVSQPCYGIIAMDFPGIDLIKRVIALNK